MKMSLMKELSYESLSYENVIAARAMECPSLATKEPRPRGGKGRVFHRDYSRKLPRMELASLPLLLP
jgi:hypothetical protein